MKGKEIVIKYAEDVVNNKIIAGRFIKLACKRFLDDFKRKDLVFLEYHIDRFIKLCSVLHHFQGEFAGVEIELSPWQLWVFANIFCWYNANGTRRYKTSYIEMAKKQGKTMQSVLFLLYANLSDGGSPETYLAANSREQARIAFNMLDQLSRQLDPKGKDIKVLRNEVKIKANNGLIKVLSSDSSKADGLNVSYAIIDEYHEAKTNAMYENLLSATAAKKNSHICIITTAGFNLTYPCYEQRNYCIQCLNEEIVDDTIFSAIYEMDEEDDMDNRDNWVKANPNMNVTVDIDFLEKRYNTAKQSPSQEVAILTKNFNKWMQSKETWLSDNYIMNQMKEFDFDDIIKQNPNQDWWFFQGCDLGSTSDMTAITTLMTNHKEFYFKTKVYLPEETLKTNFNKEAYKVWRKGGYLEVTNGNVTDYIKLAKDVVDFGEAHDVTEFGYDKYNATSIVIDMVNQGVNCVEYGQNMLNFNAPTKMLEKLILEGNAIIEKSPLVRWCFSNVELRMDLNGNVKPDKSNREKKIDPIISMITALGCYLRFFNN